MGVPLHVLIVEDSEDDGDLVVRELRRGGYDVHFERVDTEATVVSAVESHEWDLIISDFSMPVFSGIDALAMVRKKRPDVPFIFVSGTMGEETAVAAMKNGAQDYLMKDNLKRLVPAVQRELRDAEERRTRKRLEQHVHQLQKFEAIGRLAGGIAHDFNNMIGAIMGWAEMGLEEAAEGTRLRERFGKIREQSYRAAKLTAQLLAFGRRQLLQRRKVNLNALVQEEMSFLGKVIGEDIEIKVMAAPGLAVTQADPTQIEQVLMNLCLNARDAMPGGGQLIIETRNVEIGAEYCRTHAYAKPGVYVLLSVSDSGVGMDAPTMERIFEPFFTTKELGRGTGLGLATVYGIVKQHGGFIYVYSEPGLGTSFRVYLLADAGAEERRETQPEARPERGTETILLADDHDGLRDSAQEMLQALGYRTILARDGSEALRLFETNKNRISLVLLDVVMPRLSGPEVYAKMSASRPELKVIFTTGYTAEAGSLLALARNGATILQKPYSLTVLSQTLRRALDGAELKPTLSGSDSV
ncbi:MAG TPA: response regulator [Candidatus Methylomirabilis sp.]|nr:response regulator [Candidatus Methylomirabilis sp.]